MAAAANSGGRRQTADLNGSVQIGVNFCRSDRIGRWPEQRRRGEKEFVAGRNRSAAGKNRSAAEKNRSAAGKNRSTAGRTDLQRGRTDLNGSAAADGGSERSCCGGRRI